MTTHFQRRSAIAPRRQQGIALIMAIIMLVIATLIGLAGMRYTSLQEKLSANLYDRAIAMQAAEYALGAAEKWLFENGVEDVTATPTVVDCSADDATICPTFPDSTFLTDGADSDNWVSVNLPADFNHGLNADSNPQYFIQFLGFKSSEALADGGGSATCNQYGSSCGSNPKEIASVNALYRVIVRSSTPTADNDRSIVVLSSLVKGS
ncbi:MAG: hypothetical protein LBE81_02660 [Azonexus sp.]|jgi:type IV pilus assembly protein PilX|uniref:pilus assembly PilX family protein n=1 Tax=Azonexus sp. TaxID=1872668 RepID=UPI00281AA407|nr:PilX N-terminal domain-containing pilus assembly protein [Azonexus sp.]MDR0775522.1 hypothetical protein [Azonexus sp.]